MNKTKVIEQLQAKGFVYDEESAEYILKVGETVINVRLTDSGTITVAVCDYIKVEVNTYCYYTFAPVMRIINALTSGITKHLQVKYHASLTTWKGRGYYYCKENDRYYTIVDNEWHTTTEALEPSCRVAKNIAISIIY